jgi:hypothetical protein
VELNAGHCQHCLIFVAIQMGYVVTGINNRHLSLPPLRNERICSGNEIRIEDFKTSEQTPNHDNKTTANVNHQGSLSLISIP